MGRLSTTCLLLATGLLSTGGTRGVPLPSSGASAIHSGDSLTFQFQARSGGEPLSCYSAQVTILDSTLTTELLLSISTRPENLVRLSVDDRGRLTVSLVPRRIDGDCFLREHFSFLSYATDAEGWEAYRANRTRCCPPLGEGRYWIRLALCKGDSTIDSIGAAFTVMP
jgi:hypothetical protein